MFFIIFLLNLPPPVSLPNGHPHRLRNGIRIHDNMALGISSRPADGLDQGSLRTQEPFFIRIQYGHQSDLRYIQSFSQQVDTHQNIKHIQPHVPDDLRTFQGINIGMQILHPYSHLFHILGQIFRHPFGQRCYQHFIFLLYFPVDLTDQIVNLAFHRLHDNFRIQQSCRPDDLFRP